MSSTIANRDRPNGQLTWPELPFGFGTGQLCSLNGGLSIRRATRFFHAAFDLGVRFIDTAPTYGQGHAEIAIGRLTPAVRDQLMLCSKVGYSFGRKAHLINAAKPVLRPILPWVAALRQSLARARQHVASSGRIGLVIDPASIRTTLEVSLRRMRREYLDLLLLHDPSIESVDNPANQGELLSLVRCGKIGAWGVSTRDPLVAARAAATPGCAVVQFPVFPEWIAENERLLPLCASHDVAIIANSVMSPLAAQPNSVEPHGRMTAEDCIAFALKQPGVRMVLCGTRNLNHLSSNVECARLMNDVSGCRERQAGVVRTS